MPPDRDFHSFPDRTRKATHFDPVAMHDDLFNSTAALFSVLRTFQPWLADMRAQLRVAVDTRDTTQLARTAHTLRGSLAQLHASAAVDCVRQLELLFKADPPAAVPSDHPRLRALEAELDALDAEIKRFLP